MNRTIRILFTAMLCFLGMVSIAQETPPSGLKPVNAQFYIHLPDSSIWHNKGVPYGWERLARYIDVPTLTSIIRNQNASAQSANFWINGNGKAYTFTAYGDSNTYSTFTPGGFTNFLSFDGGSTYDDGFIGATGLHIKRGLSYMSFNPRSGQDLVDVSGNFIFGDLVKTSILSNNFSISGATDNNSINSTFGLVDSHGDPLPRINFNVSNNNTGTSGQVSINDAGVNFSGAGGQLNIDNSGVVVSDNTGKGAVYGGDYEAGFVDRSLVTKQYVTGSYLAKADTATLARKNGNSSITNLNYKANGTAGNGYIEIKSQTVSPSSSTGAIRLYADSLNRLSWKNSTYRRTLRVNRPLDQTITFPWKQNPTLTDSTDVDAGFIKNTTTAESKTIALTTGVNNVFGTTPSVVNVNGSELHSNTETAFLSNRPVSASYIYTASPSTTLSGTSDFHGIDLIGKSSSANMANGGLYPFETTARWDGTGTLLRAFASYAAINNSTTGRIITAVNQRIRLINSGTIDGYTGILIEAPDQTGGGTITNNGIGIQIDAQKTWGIFSQSTNNFLSNLSTGNITATGTGSFTGALSSNGILSGGSLAITGSGTVGGSLAATGQLSGSSLQTGNANSTLFVPSTFAAVTNASSAFNFATATTAGTQFIRTGFYGNGNTVIGVGTNYASTVFGTAAFTMPSTGVNLWATTAAFMPPAITAAGTSSLTNGATVYIKDQTTGATNNYSLFVAAGLSRFVGDVQLAGSNSTAVTQTAGDNSTKLATTAYADAIAALKANIANPSFTGTANMQGIRLGYKSVTASTTFGAGDFGVNITSGTFTQALPTTPNFGMVYAINNTGTGVITVTATSIAGLTSVILSPGEWIMVQYTGVSGTYTILSSSVNSPKSLRLTGSGTGAATTISIPHGLTGVTAASIVTVQPINAASQGVQYVTADATFINITYSAAPILGTGNLAYNVIIKP